MAVLLKAVLVLCGLSLALGRPPFIPPPGWFKRSMSPGGEQFYRMVRTPSFLDKNELWEPDPLPWYSRSRRTSMHMPCWLSGSGCQLLWDADGQGMPELY